MILHTVGDSHCESGWENIKMEGLQICTHHVGPITCSGFAFSKLGAIDITKNYCNRGTQFNFNIAEGDAVCFFMGDIDCGAHIGKHPENYKEVTDKIVTEYFEAIKANVDQFKNLTVMVSFVTPVAILPSHIKNDLFPLVGTNEERKIYKEYMNSKIKEKCAEYGYKYFDVYDKYCDINGYLNSQLSDGNVHIVNTKYIEEELRKIFNLSIGT